MEHLRMESTQGSFADSGYALLRCTSGRDSHGVVRDKVLELTANHERVAMKASDLLCVPEILETFFSDTLLGALQSTFEEDYVFMPALTIRKNWYEDWHIDAAFRGPLGGSDETPDFIQCAQYFQPNITEGGGGLSVIPGTHKRTKGHSGYVLNANYFNVDTYAVDVPNSAGDYVIWDGRLVHRSTAAGPKAVTRLAMFATVARASSPYRDFVAHLAKRALGDAKAGRAEESKRFTDASTLRLAELMPESVIERVSHYGGRFAE